MESIIVWQYGHSISICAGQVVVVKYKAEMQLNMSTKLKLKYNFNSVI